MPPSRPSSVRSASAPLVLACDIGGTAIKVGLVRGGRLLARREFPAEAKLGLAAAFRRLARAWPALCREAGVKWAAVSGLGLAFPGIVDPRTGRILSAPKDKFPDAPHFDATTLIDREFGLPSVVANDANAALVGEWRHGAARRCRSAVMMTLGTGIGTSAIIEGVPLRGQHGQAGCLGGHLTIAVDGPPCLCGNLGCAEGEASTWALARLAAARPDWAGSRLARAPVLDYASVFAAAARRDVAAVALRDHSVRVWACTLVSLIHAYDPECAVIGGGVMGSRSFILPRLRDHLRRHAWTPWGQVRLRPAALGNDAGLIGMAWLLESTLSP